MARFSPETQGFCYSRRSPSRAVAAVCTAGGYVPIVPTEAINGRLEHLRGSALGFRNLTHGIARSLSEAGGFRLRLHPAGRRWYFHRHDSEGKEGKGAEPRRVW